MTVSPTPDILLIAGGKVIREHIHSEMLNIDEFSIGVNSQTAKQRKIFAPLTPSMRGGCENKNVPLLRNRPDNYYYY